MFPADRYHHEKMKWLKTVMVWTMLALWLPITNHCRLEQIPSLAFLACCPHDDSAPHQDNDCDTDGCAQIENAFYKVEDTQIVATAPVLLATGFLQPLLEQETQPSPVLSDFPTVASPEFPVTWQFSCRAAAPPRAPSLVS
jgi:hypothetical protein